MVILADGRLSTQPGRWTLEKQTFTRRGASCRTACRRGTAGGAEKRSRARSAEGTLGHSRRSLFNRPVCALEYRLWDCDSQAFGSLEVGDNFELGRLLHWKVAGFCAFQ